jgi:hypothetical protein
MPKPPPIYVTELQNISPLTQLLEQTAREQYEVTALADNQINVQPKTSERYDTTVRAVAEKHIEFHNCKLKEEISYSVVL